MTERSAIWKFEYQLLFLVADFHMTMTMRITQCVGVRTEEVRFVAEHVRESLEIANHSTNTMSTCQSCQSKVQILTGLVKKMGPTLREMSPNSQLWRRLVCRMSQPAFWTILLHSNRQSYHPSQPLTWRS